MVAAAKKEAALAHPDSAHTAAAMAADQMKQTREKMQATKLRNRKICSIRSAFVLNDDRLNAGMTTAAQESAAAYTRANARNAKRRADVALVNAELLMEAQRDVGADGDFGGGVVTKASISGGWSEGLWLGLVDAVGEFLAMQLTAIAAVCLIAAAFLSLKAVGVEFSAVPYPTSLARAATSVKQALVSQLF